MVVATVTQNFEVIKTSPSTSSPLIRTSSTIKFENSFPNAKHLNNLSHTAKLNKRILLFEQPIVKFTSDSIALLPKSHMEARKNDLNYYEHLNESLYEQLLKSKRAKLISQLNESRSISSFSMNQHQSNQDNSLVFTSDKFYYATKSCDLTSFVNFLTNKRRKSTLSSSSSTYSRPNSVSSKGYSQLATKKPIEMKTPRVELFYDGPYCCLSPSSSSYHTNKTSCLSRAQTAIGPSRAHTASPYKTRPLGGGALKVVKEADARQQTLKNKNSGHTRDSSDYDIDSVDYEASSSLNNPRIIISTQPSNDIIEILSEHNDDNDDVNTRIKMDPSSTPELYDYRDYLKPNKVGSFASIQSTNTKNKTKKNSKSTAQKTLKAPNIAINIQQYLSNSNEIQSKSNELDTFPLKEKRQKKIQNKSEKSTLDLQENLMETINVSSVQSTKTQIDNNIQVDDFKFKHSTSTIKQTNSYETLTLSYDKMSPNVRKTNNAHSNGTVSNEPQTLIGKEIERETISFTQNSNSNKNYNKFSSVRHQISLPQQNQTTPDIQTKEDYLYVKPTLMQMLDFELSESKKDELTAREIFSTIKEVKINTNIGRLALSKNVCRFELPFDVRTLEKMEPLDYLRRYCKINDRRKALYKKIFDKLKIKHEKEDYLDAAQLEESLMEVHSRSITKTQYDQIRELACLELNANVNYLTFTVLAALSERILYGQFVTEDTMDLPDYQKDKIECADFGSLKSKLDGIHLNSSILTLLEAIQKS